MGRIVDNDPREIGTRTIAFAESVKLSLEGGGNIDVESKKGKGERGQAVR